MDLTTTAYKRLIEEETKKLIEFYKDNLVDLLFGYKWEVITRNADIAKKSEISDGHGKYGSEEEINYSKIESEETTRFLKESIQTSLPLSEIITIVNNGGHMRFINDHIKCPVAYEVCEYYLNSLYQSMLDMRYGYENMPMNDIFNIETFCDRVAEIYSICLSREVADDLMWVLPPTPFQMADRSKEVRVPRTHIFITSDRQTPIKSNATLEQLFGDLF